jgi:membrane fusion protein (multidrug efflux system)
MKIKSYLFLAAVDAVLSSCGGQSQQLPADNSFAVRTAGVSNADLQTTYPATIKGIQDVEVRPKVSGFITKVYVHEGQRVSAGQILFEIDNETYQASVRQAQAAVNTARSQMNTAKLTYENNKKLFEKNVIGQYELSTAQNSYMTAKASVAQAEASLASAKEMLDFCYVKSPASGVVGSLPYKVGALVSSSSQEALTTISDVSTVEVFFSMSESEILNLTKTAGNVQGAISSFPSVKLQLADGTVYNQPGKVVKMSGVIDATTGSISLIAHFANPNRLLKSGGAGKIIIPNIKGSQNQIIIPQEATVEVQDKFFVYVVTKDSKVKYTEITVNPQNDGKNYIVTSGLHVGDRFVSKGITKLNDGMAIKPITEAQYQKQLDEAAELAKKQGTAKGFIEAMTK